MSPARYVAPSLVIVLAVAAVAVWTFVSLELAYTLTR